MPGNWFEIKNINHDKTFPYDLDALKDEILKQIMDRAEKLSIINIDFGNIYPKNTIEDIDFYLDQEQFAEIAEMMKNETRHPMVTFHGTTKLETVMSIIEHGYLIPGDPNSIIVIQKAHGAAYGPGVYSTPFFDKAMYYTRSSETKYVYILVNFLLLGKIKMIPAAGILDKAYPKVVTSSDGIVDHVYKDGSNTRIVFGLDQIISANKKRVVPMGVIRIKID